MPSETAHQVSTKRKLITKPYRAMVGAMLVLIFSSQNMQTVAITLIIGTPVKAPLILIIVGALSCGLGVGTLIARRDRKRLIILTNQKRENAP